MNKIIYSVCFVIIMLSGHDALAHHSFAATFKAGDKITVMGTVTKFSFKNPHILVYYDVVNDDNSITNWVSEGSAATLMRRAGWSKNTFKIGESVQITGDATHDGSPMTSIDTIDVVDPKNKAVLRSISLSYGANTVAPIVKAVSMPLTLSDGRPNLAGAWTRHGMNAGRPPAPNTEFNAAGLALQEGYSLADDPQVFCDAPGLVRQVGVTPHPMRVTLHDDRVEFAFEEYGGHRVVYFDNRDAKGIKTNLGDSIARYEGDSLIIETNNLLSNVTSPEGQRLSDSATVTEVYTREVSDVFGPILALTMTVKDPEYLAEDLVIKKAIMSAGEYEFIENDCKPPLRERVAVSPSMSFFLTSEGVGDGANLGGLEGADAHCKMLAATVGQGDKNWHAYLSTTSSTTGSNAVNARDRIGSGPWYNAEGIPIATSIDNLHSESNNITKATVVTERAGTINGRGDTPNRHDILTGSQSDGSASVAGATDSTCSNWTSNSEGSALAGHFDRVGGGANPTSWNNAHPSRGCSQENLQGTGGDGLFYCFANE